MMNVDINNNTQTPHSPQLLSPKSPMNYDSSSRFTCNICLDDVVEPVVTQCGHLYCWSCLYTWLEPGIHPDERRALLNVSTGMFGTAHTSRIRSLSSTVFDERRLCCPVCKAECLLPTLVRLYVPNTNNNRKSDANDDDQSTRLIPALTSFSSSSSSSENNSNNNGMPFLYLYIESMQEMIGVYLLEYNINCDEILHQIKEYIKQQKMMFIQLIETNYERILDNHRNIIIPIQKQILQYGQEIYNDYVIIDNNNNNKVNVIYNKTKEQINQLITNSKWDHDSLRIDCRNVFNKLVLSLSSFLSKKQIQFGNNNTNEDNESNNSHTTDYECNNDVCDDDEVITSYNSIIRSMNNSNITSRYWGKMFYIANQIIQRKIFSYRSEIDRLATAY